MANDRQPPHRKRPHTPKRLWNRLKHAARWRVHRALGIEQTVSSFLPHACVDEQIVRFSCEGHSLEVSADYRTPLYEMVAEVVGIDCYRLTDAKSVLLENCVIVDAGANVGVASLVMATRFDRPVLALEPIPDNRKCLSDNLRRNRERRVEVLPLALASEEGNGRLWQDPTQSVSAHFNEIATEDKPLGLHLHSVELVSLSGLLERINGPDIGLLKMDIEGAEHEIINSLDLATARRVHMISLEVHDLDRKRNIRTLVEKLQNLAYMVDIAPHIGARRGLHYIFARQQSA